MVSPAPVVPSASAPEQDHDLPLDMEAFGVALTDEAVDRDDVAAGHLGAIELGRDVQDEDDQRIARGAARGDEDALLVDTVQIERASDGEETQASILLDADASPDLNVSLTLSEVDEGLDGGEEGPADDESRTDVSTSQLADESEDDDDAPWKAFSDQRHIGEKPWTVIAERDLSMATASEARIALTPALLASTSAFAADGGALEETLDGAMSVTAAGIVVSGAVWLPFYPTALAKLHDDVLVVATDQAGTCHVYAGRLDEAAYLVFVIDREDGDTEVRDIVETGDNTVLLRGPFGEIELRRV